ncbi:hypothetical protein AOLI_G00144610 [Acnodon oligacanthus]
MPKNRLLPAVAPFRQGEGRKGRRCGMERARRHTTPCTRLNKHQHLGKVVFLFAGSKRSFLCYKSQFYGCLTPSRTLQMFTPDKTSFG